MANFATSFLIFEKNKVCQQTILMKYHTLFVIFEENGKFWTRRLLQIMGGV